jgi:hypothetical protein
MTKRSWSSRTFIYMIGVVALASERMTVAAGELEFDHVWIVLAHDRNRAAQLRS